MLAYSLNKNLDGNKILKDIQNLISDYNGNNDKILVIQIREIVKDSTDHIPKLEYKKS